MARTNTIRQTLYALGIAGLSALPLASTALADGKPSCALLLSSSVAGLAHPHQLEVVRTQKLFRTEQKPYVHVPEGAAIWVKAPEGTTAADLHKRLTECVKATDGSGTPVCVTGARISVDRDHGLYVVHVKSDSRSTALEIQRRAERL